MKDKEPNLDSQSEPHRETIGKDLTQLYNYPSIGKLFATEDSIGLDSLRTKLNATREQLDTVVRRGTAEESVKASRVLKAISLTLNFLLDLEEKRKNNAE